MKPRSQLTTSSEVLLLLIIEIHVLYAQAKCGELEVQTTG